MLEIKVREQQLTTCLPTLRHAVKAMSAPYNITPTLLPNNLDRKQVKKRTLSLSTQLQRYEKVYSKQKTRVPEIPKQLHKKLQNYFFKEFYQKNNSP